MKKEDVNRFNNLYENHLRSLKLQGKAKKTIDAYARAIRRARDYFDCCPDKLTPEQLKVYPDVALEFTHCNWICCYIKPELAFC